MSRNFLAEYAKYLASVLAVIALILFIPAGVTQSLGLRVFFIVLIALFLFGGVTLLYLGHKASTKIINYFLYDAEHEKKIPKQELAFEHVEKGLSLYLKEYIDDPMLLWDEMPQRLRKRLGDEPHFRPLVAYRMLRALSDLSARDIRVIFSGTDERTVAYLCRSLSDAGDKKMADFIFDMKKKCGEESTKIVGFFRKNRTLFEERMVRFVKEHLHEFDLNKEEMNER